MDNILNILTKNYVFAVIRGNSEKDGYKISKAAIAGGIKNIEITFSTPNATKVIKSLIKEYKKEDTVIVGAGTVMTLEEAQDAYNVGAQFLVSPHFSEDIAKFSVENEINYMPGCTTVTEIVRAMDAGCEIIKLFPGGLLGPSFIKDVHGPIPQVSLMPSGGVSLENIKEWKDFGAVAVGVGSALGSKIDTEGYGSVTEISKQFINALEDK